VSFPRPVLAASLCLGDSRVRYDGQAVRDGFFAALAPHVELRPVCPEVEIGLGVPRAPIHRLGDRLVQPSTGRDLTDLMVRFADGWLDALGPIDGVLLKSRSPSCAPRDAKQPDGRRGPGLFAERLLRRRPEAVVEDEGRMRNRRLREHFLARLFAHAALREVRTPGQLVAFHARHKLLLMACSERALRELGRIVASPKGRLAEYAARFRSALASAPRVSTQINALEHALGYFREDVSGPERRHFLKCLADLRAGKTVLSVPVALLRGWLLRHPKPYLEGQAFLDPFPEALVDLADSGAP
jgi:uncharacterized protein YbgA (DUF1722 family)/uncharacterized protein YbbK (DUF523 family)